MKNRTRNQGGSVVGFLAVGVLLAVVLIGGLYVVQRYKSSIDESTEIAVNSQSNDEKNTSENANSNTDSTSGSSANNDKSTTNNTDSSTTNNSTTSSSSSQVSGSASSAESSTATTRELPQTGPAETATQMAAISALTFAIVAYLRSRRASLDF